MLFVILFLLDLTCGMQLRCDFGSCDSGMLMIKKENIKILCSEIGTRVSIIIKKRTFVFYFCKMNFYTEDASDEDTLSTKIVLKGQKNKRLVRLIIWRKN